MVLWLQDDNTRSNDIHLVRDLTDKGVGFIIVGTNIPGDLPGLHIECSKIQSPFQGIIDIIPMQLASSILAEKKGVDPDNFLYCNFIVEQEGGL
jgi:glucosamine 6-phosphate synthetase-like amidotransferase/phosphosugar isomerase protein